MSDPAEAVAELRLASVAATERLVDLLATRGFDEDRDRPGTWIGRVTIPGHQAGTVVAVTLTDYPFKRPIVTPLDEQAAEKATRRRPLAPYHEVGNSWHREPDGQLCLFEDAEHTRLPWADPRALWRQIEDWLLADIGGWVGDDPVLDLERYLPRTGELFLLEDDLSSRVGRAYWVRRSDQVAARVLGERDRRPRNRNWRWKADLALVADFGPVDRPIKDWDSLLAAAGAQADPLRNDVETGLRQLIVLYRHGDHDGALALRLLPTHDSVEVEAHRVAYNNEETRVRRAHPQAARLQQCRVAVVGVGAVGSVVADLLHRSGVGSLHLVDPDIMLPGNPVRHLVDAGRVGWTKVDAVAEHLGRRRSPECTVGTSADFIVTLTQASELLTAFDLVVDATADSTGSALLGAAADAGAGRLVQVAVLADGYAIRVDHRPPPLGNEPLPEPELPPPSAGSIELGCSSPVSTTPPAAVWEAAAMAVRHVIDELLDVAHPAGEERILRHQVAP